MPVPENVDRTASVVLLSKPAARHLGGRPAVVRTVEVGMAFRSDLPADVVEHCLTALAVEEVRLGLPSRGAWSTAVLSYTPTPGAAAGEGSVPAPERGRHAGSTVPGESDV